MQRAIEADLFEPLTFLKHCQLIGAGGMQAAMGVLNADRVRALRVFSEQQQMFIDGMVNPLKDNADLGRFAWRARWNRRERLPPCSSSFAKPLSVAIKEGSRGS